MRVTRPPAPRSRRPTVAAKLLVAALLCAAAVGPVAALGAGEAAAQGCGPAPAGRVAVAVVIDDGTGISERCVVVDDRTDGYAVLRAAGHQLRIEAGFLCAIDGYPATGCGNRPGFDGSYWRYFHATPGGSWTYSSVGGGGYRMPPRCAIEGWRWTTSGTTDTPPRTPPPPVTCEAPPVTAPPAVPAPPATSPAPAPVAPAPAAPAPGATPGAGAASPPAAPDTSEAGPADGTPGADGSPGAPGVPADGGATAEVEGSHDDADVPDAGAAAGDDTEERAADGRVATARAAEARRSDGDGNGSPVGAVLAVVVVALLGGAAVWRSRRTKLVEAGESVEGP